jgi:polygalacturonase
LRAQGRKNVFITGPLTLRPGVTLVVDAHTALVASRDPRLYDLVPGSCGILGERGHGCKPLIFGDGVKDGGIMGEGSIDARGGAKLLGQDVTWWDLAHEAKVKDLQQSVPALIVLRHADGFTMYKITLRNSPGFHVSVG